MLHVNRVRDFSKVGDGAPVPNLIDIQIAGYDRFLQADADPTRRKNEGLEALLREIFPIVSYDGNTQLDYLYYELGEPRYTPQECRDLRLSYGAPFRIRCRLSCKDAKDVIEESIYIGEIPLMVGGGEFIINGAERVIVSQLHRSPGVDFSVAMEESDRPLHSARIIPERGSWIEMDVNKKEYLTIRIDQSGKIPATSFLRAMDAQYGTTAAIIREFYETKTLPVDQLQPGMHVVEAVVDRESGEELVPAGGQIGEALTRIAMASSGARIPSAIPQVLRSKFDAALRISRWGSDAGDTPSTAGVYLFRRKGTKKRIDYVGLATDLCRRFQEHWGEIGTGNVEGSNLRWHIWEMEIAAKDDKRPKGEVKKDKQSEGAITRWMEANLEGGFVEVDLPKKEWHQLRESLERTELEPKKRYGDDIPFVLSFLEDRLMLEFPASDSLPVPRYNLDEPPQKPELILRVWSRDPDKPRKPASPELRSVEVILSAPDPLILNTLLEDAADSHENALLRIYARLRPGNPPQLDKAKTLFKEKFYDENRYRLGKVGRFRINRKFRQDVPERVMTLRPEDVLNTLKYIVLLRSGEGVVDDIDHLGNRRLRTIDELATDELRKGFLKLRRTVQERLSLRDRAELTKVAELVNSKSISASIDYFFGRGELSQVVDQQNPLSQLTHERRLSALGPGGLNRKRAGFEVRDVHISHYGRICPIETPEGNNIGLISSLAIYAGVDQYGFLVTPYRRVKNGRVTDEVVMLRADEEMEAVLAPPDALVGEATRQVSSEDITEYMTENWEFGCVPVPWSEGKAESLWGEVEKVLGRGRRSSGDSDVKGILKHLEDRLIVEFKEPIHNVEMPKSSPDSILHGWSSGVPSEIKEVFEACLKVAAKGKWYRRPSDAKEDLHEEFKLPGVYLIRDRRSDAIIYVGIAGERKGTSGLEGRLAGSHYANNPGDNLRRKVETLLAAERSSVQRSSARLRLPSEHVLARAKGEVSIVPGDQVEYLDISPKQTVGISAALIPFLEHDDANRALMGSNMQRQAVPLIRTEPPIVATGLERPVAENSSMVVRARKAGVVTYVDAERIILDNSDEYELRKFNKLNERACLNQKPIVREGQRVKRGEIIADGSGTCNGELALGNNVLVAFMPFDGYNFEDAIVISSRLVKDDTFTSVHLEEYEVEIRETKLGREEFTRDIPNVSERALRYLDEHGIVRVGTRVGPGDILVGKVSPKSKSELSPEEKLLHAIFGRAGEDVKNDSLELPAGEEGVVVDTRRFSRRMHMTEEQKVELNRSVREYRTEMNRRMTRVFRQMVEEMNEVLGAPLVDPSTRQKVAQSEIEAVVMEQIEGFTFRWVKTTRPAVRQQVESIHARYWPRLEETRNERDRKIEHMKRGDELPSGVLEMVKVRVATKRKLGTGDKMAGRHGNKGVIARIVAEEDMPFMADGTSVQIVLNPLGVPGRMNLGQILETHLGWAAAVLGFQAITPVFDGATEEEIRACIDEANTHVRTRRGDLSVIQKAGDTREVLVEMPSDGKVALYDGRTGEPFEQRVTVGYLYMDKLHHLVDEKIHARATGPYSLITQQPLGGKARTGGQRFGEMEVWALEAYGASYTLQELLTVKSDDVEGRTKIYESMVKGTNTLDAGTPVSFDVLCNELRGLGLNIQLEKKRLV